VVVDLLGREIVRLVDGHLAAGYHQVTWDGKTHWGKEAPSGMYIVRMFIPPTAGAAPGFIRQVKMVLLR
jgi:flagellar hook assembly protein FlgD